MANLFLLIGNELVRDGRLPKHTIDELANRGYEVIVIHPLHQAEEAPTDNDIFVIELNIDGWAGNENGLEDAENDLREQKDRTREIDDEMKKAQISHETSMYMLEPGRPRGAVSLPLIEELPRDLDPFKIVLSLFPVVEGALPILRYGFSRLNMSEEIDGIFVIDPLALVRKDQQEKTASAEVEKALINAGPRRIVETLMLSRTKAIAGVIDIGNHIYFLRGFGSFPKVKWMCPYVWPDLKHMANAENDAGMIRHFAENSLREHLIKMFESTHSSLCYDTRVDGSVSALVFLSGPLSYFIDTSYGEDGDLNIAGVNKYLSEKLKIKREFINIITTPDENGLSIVVLLYGAPFEWMDRIMKDDHVSTWIKKEDFSEETGKHRDAFKKQDDSELDGELREIFTSFLDTLKENAL